MKKCSWFSLIHSHTKSFVAVSHTEIVKGRIQKEWGYLPTCKYLLPFVNDKQIVSSLWMPQYCLKALESSWLFRNISWIQVHIMNATTNLKTSHQANHWFHWWSQKAWNVNVLQRRKWKRKRLFVQMLQKKTPAPYQTTCLAYRELYYTVHPPWRTLISILQDGTQIH